MRALQILKQAETYFAQKLVPTAIEEDQYLLIPSQQSPIIVFAASDTGKLGTIVEQFPSVRRVIIAHQYDYAATIFERKGKGWDYKHISGKWEYIVIPELNCTISITDLFKGVATPFGV